MGDAGAQAARMTRKREREPEEMAGCLHSNQTVLKKARADADADAQAAEMTQKWEEKRILLAEMAKNLLTTGTLTQSQAKEVWEKAGLGPMPGKPLSTAGSLFENCDIDTMCTDARLMGALGILNMRGDYTVTTKDEGTWTCVCSYDRTRVLVLKNIDCPDWFRGTMFVFAPEDLQLPGPLKRLCSQ